MNEQTIKERMREIKNKMALIEWDKKRSNTFSKDHLYEELKQEYGKLESQLNAEITEKI